MFESLIRLLELIDENKDRIRTNLLWVSVYRKFIFYFYISDFNPMYLLS